ncbi:MAG: extracellular solute-binding protein [Succinivibrio sp.]|jgi:arabinogalactan oligomer/maltooligosaccharide transport system substrate-binding protein|nr:extracellular solute-binding protein [Succinivibrio sp.]
MNNICKTSIAVALGSFFAMSSYAKDVLVVWEDLNKAHSIDMAVADFEKNNDCKVVVREFNPVNHLELADSSDEKPDVFIIISDKADYAKESGRIERLDYMPDVKDLYLENSVKPFSFDDGIYAQPRDIEALVVFYNKDIISHPADTFDDYIRLAKVRKRDGKYGLIGKFDNFYYSYGFLSAFGAYTFGKKRDGSIDLTDLGFNKYEAVDAIEYIWNYACNYQPQSVQDKNGLDVIDDLFVKGEAAAVISGPWRYDKYANGHVNFGVSKLPLLPNGNSPTPFYGVKGYVVSSDSKHKELAKKFVRLLDEPAYAMDRYMATHEVPVLKSIITNPEISGDEMVSAVLAQIKDADLMPANMKIDELWATMNECLSDVISGKKSARAAANEAVNKIKSQQ